MLRTLTTLIAALAATAHAHDYHNQEPIAGPHKSLWYNTLPGDGGTQVGSPPSRPALHTQQNSDILTSFAFFQADSVFSGISTFGRIQYHPCLASDSMKYDIAFLGAPFDTGTSYRPGARFGPSGIRQGSRRLNL